MSKNSIFKNKKLNIPILLVALALWIFFGVMVYKCVTMGNSLFITFSVFVGILALLFTVAFFTAVFKPSNKAALDKGNDVTATIVNYYRDNGNDYEEPNSNSTYLVVLEYMDDNGQLKRTSPLQSFTGKEVAYLQKKEKFSVHVYKNTCVINEDLSGVETSDLAPVKPKPKQEPVPVEEMSDSHIGRTFKFYLKRLIIYCIIDFAAILIGILCRRSLRLYLFPISIIFAVSLVFLIIQTIKCSRQTITAKYGKRVTAIKFSCKIKHLKSGNYSHNISFTFKTESGKEKVSTTKVSNSQYEQTLKINKLPIIVYKNSAVVDFARLVKTDY